MLGASQSASRLMECLKAVLDIKLALDTEPFIFRHEF